MVRRRVPLAIPARPAAASIDASSVICQPPRMLNPPLVNVADCREERFLNRGNPTRRPFRRPPRYVDEIGPAKVAVPDRKFVVPRRQSGGRGRD